MNPELDNLEKIEVAKVKHEVFRVTKTSKYLAMLLFIIMPFIGGWVGYEQGLKEQFIAIESDSFDRDTSLIVSEEAIERHLFWDEGFSIVIPEHLESTPTDSSDVIFQAYDPNFSTRVAALKVYKQQSNVNSFTQFVAQKRKQFASDYPELIGAEVDFETYSQTASDTPKYAFKEENINGFKVLRHKRNMFSTIGNVNDMYIWADNEVVYHFSSEQDMDASYLSLEKVGPPKLAELLRKGMLIGRMTLFEYGPYQSDYSDLDYGNVRMFLKGPIEVTGAYEYVEYESGFSGYCMRDFSEETLDALPYVFYSEPAEWFCFKNEKEVFEKLGKEKKVVTVLIDNYELVSYPSEVVDRVDLVSVVQ